MHCPACGNTMTEVDNDGILVDVCKNGCGGLWFDWLEVKKVDELHESIGEALLDVETDPNLEIDYKKRRDCPHCAGVVMMRHFASVKRDVEVDECPKCGGFFLDHGELNDLRRQFSTDEERSEAAQAYFADLYDQGLAEMEGEGEERLEKARGISKMFRFLSPSFYLPGKQKWGAY